MAGSEKEEALAGPATRNVLVGDETGLFRLLFGFSQYFFGGRFDH